MKTTIPLDFKVTEVHRNYCESKGWLPSMADVWLTDFIECFLDNKRKHENWDMTFKRYIRQNSPEGSFYKPEYWERMTQKAKQLAYGERKRVQHYDPKGREDKTLPTRPDFQKALENLKKLRQETGI